MSGRLTKEFAESQELSRNPVSRHREVRDLLADPAIVGIGIEVDVNETPVNIYARARVRDKCTKVIKISSFLPLGRRTLIAAANQFEQMDNR